MSLKDFLIFYISLLIVVVMTSVFSYSLVVEDSYERYDRATYRALDLRQEFEAKQHKGSQLTQHKLQLDKIRATAEPLVKSMQKFVQRADAIAWCEKQFINLNLSAECNFQESMEFEFYHSHRVSFMALVEPFKLGQLFQNFNTSTDFSEDVFTMDRLSIVRNDDGRLFTVSGEWEFLYWRPIDE